MIWQLQNPEKIIQPVQSSLKSKNLNKRNITIAAIKMTGSFYDFHIQCFAKVRKIFND